MSVNQQEKDPLPEDDLFRATFERASVGIIHATFGGRVIRINQKFCELTGFSATEAGLVSFKDITYPDDLPVGKENFNRLISGEIDSFSMEKRLVRKDGSIRWVNLSASATSGKDGQPRYLIGLIEDIDRRKRAEEELKQAKEKAEQISRMKNSFLAKTSHELRTPLNGIMGMTDLAMMADTVEEQQEYLEMVKSSAEFLLRIISDILDFARIEAGRVRLEETEFDLRKVVERTLQHMAVLAGEKGLGLESEISPDVPTKLVGDPVRIQQVLTNLLSNAVKFTETGQIEVTVKVANRITRHEPSEHRQVSVCTLQFSVRDTGMGIPAAKMDHIFHDYVQLEGAARKHGGTGLGLAISRNLVELMGGSIWLESIEGSGSTFHFTLELAEA